MCVGIGPRVSPTVPPTLLAVNEMSGAKIYLDRCLAVRSGITCFATAYVHNPELDFGAGKAAPHAVVAKRVTLGEPRSSYLNVATSAACRRAAKAAAQICPVRKSPEFPRMVPDRSLYGHKPKRVG